MIEVHDHRLPKNVEVENVGQHRLLALLESHQMDQWELKGQ
jgi:hypothetical protein